MFDRDDLILLRPGILIMESAYLGIGSNLGERESNLRNSVEKLGEYAGKIVKVSSVYETDPWGFSSDDKFLNMVIELETSLKPSGLLGRLLMIESMMGRLREGKQYSSRIIDIDILFYGDLGCYTKALEIPHPKLHERKFVLVPLAEIAPNLVHPVFKKSVSELLRECSDESKIRLHDSTIA
jgi:2-amino-4-hydroxy-6-hydroxymethyldihydropteridine diphosphokinase